METFSAPAVKSNLYVRPEVIIAGKKYVSTGSRFLCSFNHQPRSFEATEAWRWWCSTIAAIAGFMGSSTWFPRVGSRALAAPWGTTGASGPPPHSGPELWPGLQCPMGRAWSGGTSLWEGWLWHLSFTDGPLGGCQDKNPTDMALWDPLHWPPSTCTTSVSHPALTPTVCRGTGAMGCRAIPNAAMKRGKWSVCLTFTRLQLIPLHWVNWYVWFLHRKEQIRRQTKSKQICTARAVDLFALKNGDHG